MDYSVFVDESHTSPEHRHYGIGLFVVPTSRLTLWRRVTDGICRRKHFTSEIKWHKIKNNRDTIDIAKEWIRVLPLTQASFQSIIVDKKTYRLWSGDRERAFYTTLNLALTRTMRLAPGNYRVLIDERPDRYRRQHEVLRLVSNATSRLSGSSASVVDAQFVSSRTERGIQMADLMLGAIAAATNMRENPTSIHAAKRDLISFIEQTYAISSLSNDTFPNRDFNIWHFPVVRRAAFGRSSGGGFGSGNPS